MLKAANTIPPVIGFDVCTVVGRTHVTWTGIPEFIGALPSKGVLCQRIQLWTVVA